MLHPEPESNKGRVGARPCRARVAVAVAERWAGSWAVSSCPPRARRLSLCSGSLGVAVAAVSESNTRVHSASVPLPFRRAARPWPTRARGSKEVQPPTVRCVAGLGWAKRGQRGRGRLASRSKGVRVCRLLSLTLC